MGRTQVRDSKGRFMGSLPLYEDETSAVVKQMDINNKATLSNIWSKLAGLVVSSAGSKINSTGLTADEIASQTSYLFKKMLKDIS